MPIVESDEARDRIVLAIVYTVRQPVELETAYNPQREILRMRANPAPHSARHSACIYHALQ
jgi:hypothetical protein